MRAIQRKQDYSKDKLLTQRREVAKETQKATVSIR